MRVIVTRVIALALLLSVSTAAHATPGLDLAVLIDQSRSMDRDTKNTVVLLRMTVDLLERNAAANRVSHRLAVITFGSSAAVEVPFTSIDSSEQLRRRIDAFRSENHGETNVLSAFTVAEGLFRALPENSERRRAIVLLTDGVLHVHGADMTVYRSNVASFAATHFAATGITLDVLLMEPHYETMWRSVARVEVSGRAPNQFLPRAYGIVARLVGTRTAESTPGKTPPDVDTLVVPPYLDVIVFDIFHAARDAVVEIYPPLSRNPIRANADGIESLRLGDVLSTLVVPRPPPGEWTIRKSRPDARVRVLSQQFFPRGMLLRPAQTVPVRQRDRVPIVYRVLDRNKRPFQELRGYALELEVALMKPGGGSITIPMRRDIGYGAGVFHSTQDILCDVTGHYWTDVRLTTTDSQGYRLDIFRDRWSGFYVHPAAQATSRRPPQEEARMIPGVTSNPGRAWIAIALFAGAIAVTLVWQKTKP